jgi:hypothetical protein
VTHASDEMRGALLSRIEQMEQRSRQMMEETANSLSAYIGEVEDRIEHRLSEPAPLQRTDFRAQR